MRHGFTLIELLVVIAIIGILSSVVMVQVQEARDKALDAKYKASIIQIRNSLELFYTTYGRYPKMTPVCDVADSPGWAESDCGTQPFMEQAFLDMINLSWIKAPDRILYTSRGADQGYVGTAGDNYQSYKLVMQWVHSGEVITRTSPWSYCPSSCTSGFCVTNYATYQSYYENIFVISNGHAMCRY